MVLPDVKKLFLHISERYSVSFLSQPNAVYHTGLIMISTHDELSENMSERNLNVFPERK